MSMGLPTATSGRLSVTDGVATGGSVSSVRPHPAAARAAASKRGIARGITRGPYQKVTGSQPPLNRGFRAVLTARGAEHVADTIRMWMIPRNSVRVRPDSAHGTRRARDGRNKGVDRFGGGR